MCECWLVHVNRQNGRPVFLLSVCTHSSLKSPCEQLLHWVLIHLFSSSILYGWIMLLTCCINRGNAPFSSSIRFFIQHFTTSFEYFWLILVFPSTIYDSFFSTHLSYKTVSSLQKSRNLISVFLHSLHLLSKHLFKSVLYRQQRLSRTSLLVPSDITYRCFNFDTMNFIFSREVHKQVSRWNSFLCTTQKGLNLQNVE